MARKFSAFLILRPKALKEIMKQQLFRCHCTVMESGRMVQIFGTFPKSTIREGEIQCGRNAFSLKNRFDAPLLIWPTILECSLVAYKANNQIKELRALPPGFSQPSPRCLPNGQFDPLQCIEDKCGCVEQDTGTPDENGFIYSVIALGEAHPICCNYLTLRFHLNPVRNLNFNKFSSWQKEAQAGILHRLRDKNKCTNQAEEWTVLEWH